MKNFFNITVFAAIVLTLSGCISAREEQNPQPKTKVPYAQWCPEKAGNVKSEKELTLREKREKARQQKARKKHEMQRNRAGQKK